MPVLSEQLIVRALAALCEIADDCGDTPARKTLSLRFLLAYTYVAAGADPAIKWIWTEFWKSATSSKKTGHQAFLDDYQRSTGARTALNGICREIGYPTTEAFFMMLRGMREVQTREISNPDQPMAANDVPTDDNAA